MVGLWILLKAFLLRSIESNRAHRFLVDVKGAVAISSKGVLTDRWTIRVMRNYGLALGHPTRMGYH